MNAEPVIDTKQRLLAAGVELFAERGFHGTKVRDIAARAGVNVAAGNYHYGSKKELYLEVLRAQFADVRALLARRGGSPSPAALARLPRAAVVETLRARVRVMFEVLVGPPGLAGRLMQREMSDPSEAFPVVVAEFIEPIVGEMEALVSRLAPALDGEAVRRSVASIAGQVHFYLSAQPAVQRLFGADAYTPAWIRRTTDHITDFSVAALDGLSGQSKGRRAR